MIRINYDLETGAAKLTQATTIKVGADVPVQVIFNAAPGDVAGMQLTLGTDAAVPAVLAYTEDFDQENDTTWTALLDASDTRLATYMTIRTATVVQAELTCLLDGAHQVTPNMPVTVQPRILTGPTTSEGGPQYLTEAAGDARYLDEETGDARYVVQSDSRLEDFQSFEDTSSGSITINVTKRVTIVQVAVADVHVLATITGGADGDRLEAYIFGATGLPGEIEFKSGATIHTATELTFADYGRVILVRLNGVWRLDIETRNGAAVAA